MNTAYFQPTDSSLCVINYTKALVITNCKVRRPQYRNVSMTTCCNDSEEDFCCKHADWLRVRFGVVGGFGEIEKDVT